MACQSGFTWAGQWKVEQLERTRDAKATLMRANKLPTIPPLVPGVVLAAAAAAYNGGCIRGIGNWASAIGRFSSVGAAFNAAKSDR